MDAGWYHRLLKGSVLSGDTIEKFITTTAEVPVDLGTQISTASAIPLPFGKEMRSKHKLNAFWLTLLAVTLGFGLLLRKEARKARDTRVAKEAAELRGDSVVAVLRDSLTLVQKRDSIAAIARADSIRRAAARQQLQRTKRPPEGTKQP